MQVYFQTPKNDFKKNETNYPSSNFLGIMKSSRKYCEMKYFRGSIILQSVFMRYGFVQKRRLKYVLCAVKEVSKK